jgi:hypothetical protein
MVGILLVTLLSYLNMMERARLGSATEKCHRVF